MSGGHDDLDDLERAVRRLLQGARRARGVPAPSPDDPCDEALLRYVDGAASPAERRELEERLRRSPRGRDLLAILTAALPAPPPPAPGPLRLVFLFAQDAFTFLRGSAPPLVVAGAVAVRGRADAGPTTWEFATHVGDLDAALVLDRAQDRVDVRLTLTREGAPVDDARVVARRDAQLFASVPTEADGGCTIGIAAAGHYHLEVRRRGATVGVVRLDFLDPSR